MLVYFYRNDTIKCLFKEMTLLNACFIYVSDVYHMFLYYRAKGFVILRINIFDYTIKNINITWHLNYTILLHCIVIYVVFLLLHQIIFLTRRDSAICLNVLVHVLDIKSLVLAHSCFKSYSPELVQVYFLLYDKKPSTNVLFRF